jgi:hypothetical protein
MNRAVLERVRALTYHRRLHRSAVQQDHKPRLDLRPSGANVGPDCGSGRTAGSAQGQQGDQVVPDAIPDQQADGAKDDGEGERLIERPAASAGLLAMAARLLLPRITRRPG